MDFFDFNNFGDDFFAVAPKENVKQKKEAVKKPTEVSVKETNGKNKTDLTIKLPVSVFARSFKETIAFPEKETVKLSEIRQILIDKGYDQFHIPELGFVYEEAVNALYVTENKVFPSSSDARLFSEDVTSVTVVDGQNKCILSVDEFPGMDYDEVPVADAIQYFVSCFPQYAGCGLCLVGAFAYPTFEKITPKSFEEDEITVWVWGEEQRLEVNSTPMDLLKSIVGDGLKVAEPVLCRASNNVYFLSYNGKASGGEGTVSSKKPSAVEKKYKLPLTLYCVNWNQQYELTSDDFGGKAKVTKDDVKKVMSQKERIFSDKDRKADFSYDEENHRLSCMFISGKKGASGASLSAEKKMDSLLQFLRELPRAPYSVFSEILEYFREDLKKEAAVRLLFDTRDSSYHIVKASGERGKEYINYVYSELPREEMMQGIILQVAEIHSHNSMPAFFSEVDDRDESNGVFGVFGNLDTEYPTTSFRIGADGFFKPLPISVLFK